MDAQFWHSVCYIINMRAMKSSVHIQYLLSAIFIMLGIAACTKYPYNHIPPPQSPCCYTYCTFSYSYWLNPGITGVTIFPGDTVQFRVACTPDTFQLNYGDGNYSVDSVSNHVYQAPGSYYASLTKGADTLNKNIITVNTPPDSNITAHLAIARHWHYCSTYDCSGGKHYDFFAITLLGKGRIIFKGDTLGYNSIYDTSTSMPYIYYSGLQGPYPYHGCDFYYYYLQDSVVASEYGDSISWPYYFSP